MAIVFDDQQQAAIDEIRNGNRHLMISAVSGAGKTSTILEGLKYLQYKGNVVLCAFSKDIERELRSRAPDWCTVKTIHSLGLTTINRHMNVTCDMQKTRKLVYEVLRRSREGQRIGNTNEVAKKLIRLVELSKDSLVGSLAEIESLCLKHTLDDRTIGANQMANLAAAVIKKSAEQKAVVDFSDMLYFPAKFNLEPPPYDVVIVDEMQDLSPSQLHFIQKMNRGRIIGVYDLFQTIYQFRSASGDAIVEFGKSLNAEYRPLSVTYRCAEKIVKYLNQWVPDMKARPGAPNGEVEKKTIEDMHSVWGAKPGDFVLSRLNAPLVGQCLRFMKSGWPAVIPGKNIGRQLINLITDSKAFTTVELTKYLQDRLRAEKKRYSKTDNPDIDDRIADFKDQIAAIEVVAEDYQYAADVQDALEKMFTDDESSIRSENVIVCTTSHKCKGLQRRRVWILCPSFQPTKNDEERNMAYVACSRAIESLFLVGEYSTTDRKQFRKA